MFVFHVGDAVIHETSLDQLVAAMGTWVLDKSHSLGEVLLQSQAIDAGTRDLILALVHKHLELHPGDSQQSLAALSSVGPTLKEGLKSLADPQVEASLATVGSRQEMEKDQPEITATVSVGQPSTDVRFRILRPHAKGGLGKVSVALDQELLREVALKEIREQHAEPMPQLMSRWPRPRLPNWVERVNARLSDQDLAAVRRCAQRGQPWASPEWTASAAHRPRCASTTG